LQQASYYYTVGSLDLINLTIYQTYLLISFMF